MAMRYGSIASEMVMTPASLQLRSVTDLNSNPVSQQPIQSLQPFPPMVRTSSRSRSLASKVMSRAAMFSSRCSIRVVPGMGVTELPYTWARCCTQASAIWPGHARCLRPTSASSPGSVA